MTGIDPTVKPAYCAVCARPLEQETKIVSYDPYNGEPVYGNWLKCPKRWHDNWSVEMRDGKPYYWKVLDYSI